MNDVILIGNGKIGQLGKAIDAHKKVFRINVFEIAGWERSVGRRVDGIFTIRHVYLRVAKMCKERNYDLPIWLCDKYKSGIQLPPSLTKYVSELISGKFTTTAHASTGIKAIVHCILTYGPIDIAGFGGEGHYWDKDHKHTKDHPWKKEKEFLSHLENIKLVTRYA